MAQPDVLTVVSSAVLKVDSFAAMNSYALREVNALVILTTWWINGRSTGAGWPTATRYNTYGMPQIGRDRARN